MRLPPALAPAAGAAAVRLLAATVRLRVEGDYALIPLWAAGQRMIYACWHGRLLLVPWATARVARKHGVGVPRVMVSRSADGEMVARFVSRFGMGVVRGSSSRGGAEALRALVAAIHRGEDVGLVPDGPRGPAERAQPGIVTLAALSGATIVPVAVAASPARRLSTWDRFLIPLPFARVAFVVGAPIEIKRDADRESARRGVEEALTDVTATADRLVR